MSCTASKLNADDAVQVAGTVVEGGGVPAANTDVALFKLADVGEVLVGAVVAVGTLGTACFVSDAPPLCGRARKVKTGTDGSFTFSLEGRDTQGSVANASDFDLTAVAPRPAGGSLVTSVRFKIQRTELDIPAVRFWDAALTASAAPSGSRIQLSWPALPGDYGDSPTYSLRFLDGAARNVVWAVPDVDAGVSVDTRLLEDRRGTIELGASTSKAGPDTKFRYTYFAQGAPFEGAGAPPSRGDACSSTTADGAVTAISPCVLTDGDLSKPSSLSADGTVRTGAFVDLGTTRSVSLVAARGTAGAVTVETSNDATTWTFAGNGSGGLVSVALDRPVEARYVRVRSTANTDIGQLAEISVWN